MDAAGIAAWRDAYEAAGIRDDDPAPADLAALAASADVIACSDAARARESARLLVADRPIVVSPLLRELQLRSPRLAGIRLPLAAWLVPIGGGRLLDVLRGGPAADRARIAEAAAWLDGLATKHVSVLVITHAWFRQAVAARLERFGWRAETDGRSWRHWSAWRYRR